MTELLTAAQMRAIEQAAIDSGEVTGLELMERAGRGVVEAIFEEWPELDVGPEDGGLAPRPADAPQSISGNVKRAVVLCGPGNNGGDGFVVARLLFERGWAVEVFLYGDAAKLPPDARVNYERWCELGEVDPWDRKRISASKADLYVDAVFGAGLTRQVPDDVGHSFVSLYAQGSTYGRLVSVDAPTGLCMDSGRPLGEKFGSVYAWLNVTFHQQRVGQFLSAGPSHCTKNVVKDIGLSNDSELDSVCLVDLPLLDADAICELLKDDRDSKFSYGHALILSGNCGQTGAARLAARGALRIGAGLVTLGVPAAAQQEAASQLTAIMLKRVGDAEALTQAMQDKRINALCLGPALGLDRAKPLVAAALYAGLEARPTVLDADALSAFEDDPAALFAMLHDTCVLTPHGGEFARLFPDIAEKLKAVPTKGPAYSKVDATREAAARAGCVVLFKGADTVIAAPDGRCAINSAHYERSAPWLATAGSGDVLAGFITGLLARGFAPMQAAETGAWLHVECALKFGPGLIAEDIPEQLPAVFRDLGL